MFETKSVKSVRENLHKKIYHRSGTMHGTDSRNGSPSSGFRDHVGKRDFDVFFFFRFLFFCNKRRLNINIKSTFCKNNSPLDKVRISGVLCTDPSVL